MKTTTIGRIGAIATGAAMLGTAVASAFAGAQAVPDSLDKGFFYASDMTPQVQVVVGDKAMASDGAAAGQIAAVIGNLAYATEDQTEQQTVTVEGGTVTCQPSDVQCGEGVENAQGEVVLSWEATGLVADLEQREMTCQIYTSSGLTMVNLTDGGDSGSWCGAPNFYESYFPDDTVSTRLVGACAVTSGDSVTLLKEDEFPNEICTICYNYCDIVLGCEPHKMTEWVNITCSEIDLEYDCDEGELVMTADDEALIYTVFTDDILTGDIQNSDGDLVGQSYLGKILLGQNEYYVEELKTDSITIVLGETGTATTSVPFEYTTPTGDTYSMKLVGAQTIEEKGVVDVTLEVTKPDGTVEQITSGISGIPVVGDIKIKLQKGTAASNVITGEQSFSADMLVWFLPSERTFEDDEQYNPEGVEDGDGIWLVQFNGGNTITVGELETLEDDELLYTGIPLPSEVEENKQWDGCYEDVSEDDNDTQILRYLEFQLIRDVGSEELPAGEMIQLPFNDGEYLLSELKFGYQGLTDRNFVSYDDQDKTPIEVTRNEIEVWNTTSHEARGHERAVYVSFVDKWDATMNGIRIDEGPFLNDKGKFFGGAYVVEVTNIRYNAAGDGALVDYKVKDGVDWKVYKRTSASDDGDACSLTTAVIERNMSVHSALTPFTVNITGWVGNCSGFTGELFVRNNTASDGETSSSGDWELWTDIDDDNVFEMATTDGEDVRTEFGDDVYFDAIAGIMYIKGTDDSGADDQISLKMNATTTAGIYYDTTACSLSSTCGKIQTGNDEDGDLVSLSGAEITIDSCEIEDPEDSDITDDVICSVDIDIPEKKVRPTLFFGTEQTQNSTSITITEADVGTIVNMGGLDVTVEEFGVTGTVSGGTVTGGEASVLQCPDATDTVPVTYTTDTVASIGYQLVVVEGSQSKSNLVLIGGPAVNSMTKDLVAVEDLEAAPVIKLSGTKLIVAGYEAEDTAAAADALVAWLKANV